jgi:hypothetical protein
MEVREALRMHEERTQLIREDLAALQDFPVTVLPAVSAEFLNHAKDEPGKRLQFLAFLYVCSVSSTGPPTVLQPLPAKPSRLGFLLKASGIAFSLGRGLLQMRSQKMQTALAKWALLLYYSVFRATAFIR